jgi:hypothetical protein
MYTDFRHIYFDAILSLDDLDRDSLPAAIPGHEWAERARKEVLGELHAPTVQSLMVSYQLNPVTLTYLIMPFYRQ